MTLCGAGIRALVNGLCKENNIDDGEVVFTKKDGTSSTTRVDNLQGKINGLYEKGKLTKENAEIFQEHRFFGNTAIHDLSSPTREKFSLALEILQQVFDPLYEIPDKGKQLKQKRLRKHKKSLGSFGYLKKMFKFVADKTNHLNDENYINTNSA